MDFSLPIDEPPLTLTAVYKDRKGNVSPATDATWTDSDPTIAAIDGASGATVNISPVGSTPGATVTIGATGGTLSATAVVTLAPGVPVSLEIQTPTPA